MFRYDVIESKAASTAIEAISARLWPSGKQESQSQMGNRDSPLQLVSMKESFNLELLSRFYNELMIPNFPLEEERDDLDDWVYCLDPAQKISKQQNEEQPHPSMDVILLVKREQRGALLLPVEENTMSTTRMTIVAGVAFEYYKQAQCGLLSYMIVSDEFRRLGIMRSLHPVACHAMQLLHQEHYFSATIAGGTNNETTISPTIKAILAETNTPEAGDVPPAVIRKRHEILYQLGYRHLKFPYIQPALAEDMESFDEIILLMYSPNGARHTTIGTEILHDYVVDFFQSVTGYDNDSYKQDWYYKLVEWFWRENISTDILQDLPWEDITQNMKECMAKSTTSNTLSTNNGTKCSNDGAGTDGDCNLRKEDSTDHRFGSSKPQPSMGRKRNHVTVIGAGIAGLVSTVTLAEEYLKNQQNHRQNPSDDYDQSPQGVPLAITLIEAQPFVGGRIRTVVTKEAEAEAKINEDRNSHPLMFSNDRLPHSQKVDSFAPWPVAIGAEFVHGVDSMANQLIEDHEEWLVHETFDLCESPEEYPSRNSFVQRRSYFTLSEEQRKTPHVEIFIDGKCYPMQDHPGDDRGSERRSSETENNRIQQLLQRANHIWQNLQYISEEVNSTNDKNSGVTYGRDMSLDEFIDDQLSNEGGNLTSEEVEKVKQILESVYSNTAGSSNKFLGIHEASREEWNWEYTESNFRLEQCFNEFVKYYLDRITQINEQATSSNLGVKIDIEIGCPVSEIGSATNCQNKDEESPSSPIRVLTRTGRTFVCDKCIVTVPLGVLKAKKLTFSGAYKIPRKTQEAIDTINMFSGMKTHMLLKVGIDIQRIPKRMKNTELLFCPGEIFSQIWLRRNEESVFLSGFCVANCREQLIQMVTNRGEVGEESKTDIARDLMLDQVQRVFESSIDDEKKIFVNPSSPTCSSFALHDWSEDEFTMGIYSSPSVGAGWGGRSRGDVLPLTHRDNLAKPINNEIWFSGEHANTTTCASVQSAMESGARAAKEVYQAIESA
jgi:hypothetical protein